MKPVELDTPDIQAPVKPREQLAESLSRKQANGDVSDGVKTLTENVSATLQRGVDHLLSLQHEDGHWCAELEGDSILQSEYILAIWILGQETEPWFAERLPKIAEYLRRQQRDDGSWGQYPGGKLGGGKFDISAAVKGYFALKLLGDDINSPHMAKARELILAHGGAERVNSFSKFYLACLGQVTYDAVPTIPPQIVYLPKWFYFHLDKVSAWSRTMIVPLSIVTTVKVKRDLAKQFDIGELFKDQRNRNRLLATGFGKSKLWTSFFLLADKSMKMLDRIGLMSPLRKRSLQHMEDWMVEHCKESDGPGSIFPPIVYLLIALVKGRGYDKDHPVIRDNHRHLSNYMIYDSPGDSNKPSLPRNGAEYPLKDDTAAGVEVTHGPTAAKPIEPADAETIHLQPCESPLWDTGIAAFALTEAGLTGEHEAMQRCADWLVSKECRKKADWVANVKGDVNFSGWFFEYHNPWYPDVDDTVMVSMALKKMGYVDGLAKLPNALAASKRAIDWILAMQNDDGGWAAFDRTKSRPLYDCVPFADHNAIQDPSCADITGRTLECLGHHGFTIEHPAVKKAIAFLKETQEPEGCWFGRWGVNYVYGTWQAVCGLGRLGQDMNEDWIQRAGQWLKQVQQEDGSFGESADSYEDPSLKGKGPSTASQTAWGTMTMLAIYGPNDAAVQRGIHWLCQTQHTTGEWEEHWFTGTGFPKVFYLRYHYYRLYFPVMCLGRWQEAMRSQGN